TWASCSCPAQVTSVGNCGPSGTTMTRATYPCSCMYSTSNYGFMTAIGPGNCLASAQLTYSCTCTKSADTCVSNVLKPGTVSCGSGPTTPAFTACAWPTVANVVWGTTTLSGGGWVRTYTCTGST